MFVMMKSEKDLPYQWGLRPSEFFVALEKPRLYSQEPEYVSAEDIPVTITIPRPGWQILTASLFSETSSKIDRLFRQLRLQGVRVKQQGEVYEYLLRFPDMIGVVEQAVCIARDHLKGAQLQLEVYHDPESEDEHLVLYARFHVYDETVMERIRFVRRQYRHLLLGKSGWFILTTDFQQPK
jgi:hypothetical protein